MLSKKTLIVLALALGAPLGARGMELVDRIVAVVGRHAITLSEAERALELKTLGDSTGRSLPDIVEKLIESYLVEREVSRYPFEPISQEEVDRAVAALRATFGSEAEFQAALRSQGTDLESLERLLKRQLVVNRYLESRFRALVYVNDGEVRSYYEEELIPALSFSGERVPDLDTVSDQIRQILTEKKFNERVDRWIESLKSRARIRRYVW